MPLDQQEDAFRCPRSRTAVPRQELRATAQGSPWMSPEMPDALLVHGLLQAGLPLSCSSIAPWSTGSAGT